MLSYKLNGKHLIGLISIILILVIGYIIDPFPPVPPSKKEIESYAKYHGQQKNGKIEELFIYQGRAHVIFTTGERIRLPWADHIKNKFGISDYIKEGDSIKIRSDTIYLIKDQTELKFRIIE